MRGLVLHALIMIFLVSSTLTCAEATPVPKQVSWHGNYIAVLMEDEGLFWIDIYSEPNLERIMSSDKGGYLEYSWSKDGKLAVRLCSGPCYDVNWQVIQVLDPASNKTWRSSEAGFIKPSWSPEGKLAIVIWPSSDSDYNEHWIELYDPVIGRTLKTRKKGYMFAKWSPDGKKLAAMVRCNKGFYVEVLDDKLEVLWNSSIGQVTVFKWSNDGKIAVRVERDGREWLEIYTGSTTWRSEEAPEVAFNWSEGGNLAYVAGQELSVVKFGGITSQTIVESVLIAMLGVCLLLIALIRYRLRKGGAADHINREISNEQV